MFSLIRNCMTLLILIFGLLHVVAAEDAEVAPSIEHQAAQTTFQAMRGLIESLKRQQQKLDKLPDLKTLESDTEALEKHKSEKKAIREEIARIESQLQVIATNIETKEFDGSAKQAFDLQAELQQLVEPFVLMLRSATEDSRAIEQLRRAIDEAQRQNELASSALKNLDQLEQQQPPEELAKLVADYRHEWQERLKTSQEEMMAFQQQLRSKLNLRESPGQTAGRSIIDFMKERGYNLLLGLVVFFLVLLGMRLVGSLVSKAVRKHYRSYYTVPMRAGALIYSILTLVAAVMGMLIVFNLRADWLLMAIGAILLIGGLWALIKILPSLMEQLSLLLNLGAVQEHERVIFDNVPWLVKTLALYTELENPALRGGNITLPVRELIGLHSRPVVEGETWFPTSEGDWVLIGEDEIAQVELQTPEQVILRRLGGSATVMSTAEFLAAPPRNLSDGYRVEVQFGIDYKHQQQATGEILGQLREWVKRELPQHLPENSVKRITVEFFSAAESSLNYEVEVVMDGSAASVYEDLALLISSTLVDACNAHGWEIPFQQLVVHKA